MEVKVRNCKITDFDMVFSLFHQLWPGKELDKNKLMDVLSFGLRSSEYEYLCAVLHGKVVGFCALAVVHSFWQEGCIAYVIAMVVDQEVRGCGIGTALMDKAADLSRLKGCKKLELDSAFHREGAHLFYETIGFSKRAFLFSKDL
ncbi:GNAT family N-acetyltransferase [Desulfitobacterium sp. Sab5]|uniref:GNAT family N-acetyltransferase n=1 Tax=Desulfitobacterium nosdiversum TaxID=3375356 RepID=UPI003CF7B7AF